MVVILSVGLASLFVRVTQFFHILRIVYFVARIFQVGEESGYALRISLLASAPGSLDIT